MNQSKGAHRQIPVDEFYVEAGNCRLKTQLINPLHRLPECNATLVFLHEGLGCIELWHDFPQRLSNLTGCRGVVYNRKGYGGEDPCGSKWPMDYLVEEANTYLPRILSACNIKKAILIGHSDGGSIALIAAATLGQSIKGIITEAAHVFVEDITLAGIRTAVESFLSSDLPERLARYHGKYTKTMFYRWANTWLNPDFRQWNIEKFLPSILCPSLIIQGEKDEYATSAQLESIGAHISGPVEVELLPNCAHSPHFQDKERVLMRMNQFIATLLRQA
jgi:pimeloyl-ACP methyl ester carboxylesterase